ncbi:MAG: hypothetical protein DME69_03705 [Verrucomicrobia bacterium]|nr:MAG: hypothetical protein DME69_03705 [Verrucomicrobiota bacterium]
MKFVADTVLFHASMLNDRRRTSSYLASIRDVVKPGDIVVDIGTGTGILAIAAVHAGARHVYAIEEARIARVARALFEANGMTDPITLIRGRSTEVRLPQRADVLICELIGRARDRHNKRCFEEAAQTGRASGAQWAQNIRPPGHYT